MTKLWPAPDYALCFGDCAHGPHHIQEAADADQALQILQAARPTPEEVDPRLFVVRAEEYGIPQARHRMFIVGIRSDLNVRPGVLKKMAAPTVQETIGSLPSIRSGLSKEKDSATAWLSELRAISSMNVRRQLNGATYAGEVARARFP